MDSSRVDSGSTAAGGGSDIDRVKDALADGPLGTKRLRILTGLSSERLMVAVKDLSIRRFGQGSATELLAPGIDRPVVTRVGCTIRQDQLGLSPRLGPLSKHRVSPP